MVAITQGDILMQTLNRAAGVAIILFFTGLGLMIGFRIDQITIALLVGVTIALLVVIPVTALVIVLIHRDQSSSAQYRVSPPVVYPPSQQYVVPPDNARAYLPSHPPVGYQDAEPFTLSPRRRFYVIGEDGSSREILPDDTDAL
jgi:hypothetical protein